MATARQRPSAKLDAPPAAPSAAPSTPEAAPFGLSPRVHNVVSYGGAVAVFLGAVLLQKEARRCPAFADTREAELLWPCELAAVCWVLHFVRRTAEAAYLHRFSQPTVPWDDTATEYLYYWGFAYWIARSLVCADSATKEWSTINDVGAVVWLIAEVGNCACHVQLARLRPAGADAGKRELSLPSGGCFSLNLSFPHYFCEISSWVGWNLLVGLPTLPDASRSFSDPLAAAAPFGGVAFATVGACIMASWAFDKHAKLRDHCDGKEGRPPFPPHRKRIIPMVF